MSENVTITGHFGFVFGKVSGIGGSHEYRNVIVFEGFAFKTFSGVILRFEERFQKALFIVSDDDVISSTIAIKLCFQIFPALCRRGRRGYPTLHVFLSYTRGSLYQTVSIHSWLYTQQHHLLYGKRCFWVLCLIRIWQSCSTVTFLRILRTCWPSYNFLKTQKKSKGLFVLWLSHSAGACLSVRYFPFAVLRYLTLGIFLAAMRCSGSHNVSSSKLLNNGNLKRKLNYGRKYLYTFRFSWRKLCTSCFDLPVCLWRC